jgi:hypothetical protein
MQNKKLSDLLWGRFLVDRLSPSPADAALLSDDSQQDLLTPGFDLFFKSFVLCCAPLVELDHDQSGQVRVPTNLQQQQLVLQQRTAVC